MLKHLCNLLCILHALSLFAACGAALRVDNASTLIQYALKEIFKQNSERIFVTGGRRAKFGFTANNGKHNDENELRTTARDFTVNDLAGIYQVDASGEGCPRSIEFKAAVTTPTKQLGGTIETYPKSSVLFNGERCNGGAGEGASLTMIKSSDLPENLLKPGTEIGDLANQTEFLVIANTKTTECGREVYPESILLAVLDQEAVFVSEGIKLPAGRKLLIYKETRGVCRSQNLLGAVAKVDAQSAGGEVGDDRERSGLSTTGKVLLGVGTFIGTIAVAAVVVALFVLFRKRNGRQGRRIYQRRDVETATDIQESEQDDDGGSEEID